MTCTNNSQAWFLEVKNLLQLSLSCTDCHSCFVIVGGERISPAQPSSSDQEAEYRSNVVPDLDAYHAGILRLANRAHQICETWPVQDEMFGSWKNASMRSLAAMYFNLQSHSAKPAEVKKDFANLWADRVKSKPKPLHEAAIEVLKHPSHFGTFLNHVVGHLKSIWLRS